METYELLRIRRMWGIAHGETVGGVSCLRIYLIAQSVVLIGAVVDVASGGCPAAATW